MRARTTTGLMLAAVVLAGCGESAGDIAREEAADVMIEFMGEMATAAGGDVDAIDEECVRSAVGKLSDADARALVDAGAGGDVEISGGAEQLNEDLFECVDPVAFGGG